MKITTVGPTPSKRIVIRSVLIMAAMAGVNVATGAPDDRAAQALREHCLECHGGEESEGGFSINSREALLDADAIEPGDADASLLVEKIRSQDPDFQMPPADRDRLTNEEVAAVEDWIDNGAPWSDAFDFAPTRYEPSLRLRTVVLPGDDVSRNPIDRIIDAYYAEHGIEPPAAIDQSTFARRLSYDLLGLPPRAEDLTVADRTKLIDEILSRDQQYAEHWMTFWSDLLRNAFSGTGYIDGGRRQITAWLYRSLLENMPFNQFAAELIAPPTDDSAGFIQGIKWRGNVNASQRREIQFSQNVAQVFLGINMKCASCHDSFIDDWSLDAAYGLAAVYSTRELEIFRCDAPTGRVAKASWIFPELGEIDAAADQPQRLQRLAELITHEENARFSRTIVNRVWSQLMGRGIVHPVDAMGSEPWNEDLLDFLAAYLVQHDYDLKAVMRLIVSSDAYQSQAAIIVDPHSAAAELFHGPRVKRMTAEQMLDTVWSIADTWPQPDGRAFASDGRAQGGQLTAVMNAHGWGDDWAGRPVRAVFTPLNHLQSVLGRPNREQVVTSRPDRLTTLEAIDLVNGAAMSGLLRECAERLLAEEDAAFDSVVKRIYQVALAREPTEFESNEAAMLLQEYENDRVVAVEDVLWSVIMRPEFMFIH